MEDEKIFVSLEMPVEMSNNINRVTDNLDTTRSAWIRAAIKRQLKIDLRRVNKIIPLPTSTPVAG